MTLTLLVGTFTCVTTASVREADDFDGDVVYNPWGQPDDNNKPGDITIDDPGVVAITIKKKDLKISIKSATKKKKSKTAKIVLSNSKVKKIIRKNVEYQIRYSIKKSMKIDKCNPLSIRYLREINEYIEDEKKNDPDKRMERRRSLRGVMVDRPYLSGNDTIMPKENFKDALTGAQSIMYVIVGILLGAALVYFIVTPARISSVTSKVNDTKVEYNQKIAIKNSTISELQNQVETLKSDKKKLKTSLAQYTGTGNTISSNYSNLLAAVQYFIAKDYTKSATALENVDGKMKMDSESFTSVYNTLNSNLSSKVEQLAFNAGIDAYESADYNEAIKQFTKALDANAENDEAMYYLGYSYRRKGDSKNAKKWFKEIVDKHQDSDFYSRAQNLLNDSGTE